MASLYYERSGLSTDKPRLAALAQTGVETAGPALTIRDHVVDLVFYHRILKCHVLLELKVAAFSHENIGQLNTYVSWYRKNMMTQGDNPPVGILLCTQKDHALVEYALAGIDNGLFVSKYLLELPKKVLPGSPWVPNRDRPRARPGLQGFAARGVSPLSPASSRVGACQRAPTDDTTDGQEVVGAGYETLRNDSGLAGAVAHQPRRVGYDGQAC